MLGLGQKSPCKTFLNGRLFMQVELLASLAAIVWLIGMCLDPVINALADPFIYKFVRLMLGKARYAMAKVSTRRLKHVFRRRSETANNAADDDAAEF